MREASKEEVEWIKFQLNPPAFYLEKFLAMKKKYVAIDVEAENKASRLKGMLTRELGKREDLHIRVYSKGTSVLLVNDDVEEKGEKTHA